MNSFSDRTWIAPFTQSSMQTLMDTHVKDPPRPVQSYGYTGPVTLSRYFRVQACASGFKKRGSTPNGHRQLNFAFDGFWTIDPETLGAKADG
jgi:hypothetical protein